jgi:hypothetical protein
MCQIISGQQSRPAAAWKSPGQGRTESPAAPSPSQVACPHSLSGINSSDEATVAVIPNLIVAAVELLLPSLGTAATRSPFRRNSFGTPRGTRRCLGVCLEPVALQVLVQSAGGVLVCDNRQGRQAPAPGDLLSQLPPANKKCGPQPRPSTICQRVLRWVRPAGGRKTAGLETRGRSPSDGGICS